MKLTNLQYVNKTPWLYVQQGKCPLINIQNFFYTCIIIYIHDVVWMLRTTWIIDYPFHSYIIWQKAKTKRRIGL